MGTLLKFMVLVAVLIIGFRMATRAPSQPHLVPGVVARFAPLLLVEASAVVLIGLLRNGFGS